MGYVSGPEVWDICSFSVELNLVLISSQVNGTAHTQRFRFLRMDHPQILLGDEP
jgi:hypothetical protein